MKNAIEHLGHSLASLPHAPEDTVIREGISINEAEKWQKALISEDKYTTSFRVKMSLAGESVLLRLDVNRLVYMTTGLVMLKEEVGGEKSAMIYKLFEKIAGPNRERNRSWVANDLSRYGGGRHLWRRLSWGEGVWLEKDRIERQPAMLQAFEFAEALKTISQNLIKVEPAGTII